MSDEQYQWPDESGTWVQDTSNLSHFKLVSCPDGSAVDARIGLGDIWHLTGASGTGGTPAESGELRFPRSFSFHPITGQPLEAPVGRPPRTWVPPYGSPGPEVRLRGTRRTAESLQVVASGLKHTETRGVASGRKADVELPGQGRFEFMVGRFGAWADSLLALDLAQDLVYAWMPASQQWLPVALPDQRPSLMATLETERWGMVLRQSQGNGICTASAYAPAEGGLAKIEPHVLQLACTVELVGRGEPRGAPIQWGQEVWMPVAVDGAARAGKGGKSSMAVCNDRDQVVPVEDAPRAGAALQPPVCSAAQVVWPAATGQLVLDRSPEGRPRARWLPWPEGFAPRFQFGAPYADRNATFWQLGWVDAHSRFDYVPVGPSRKPAMPAEGWRFNTESVVYHRRTRWRHAPWNPVPLSSGLEPAAEFVMPLLESDHEHGCICLLLHPATVDQSIDDIIGNAGRQRAELFYQADDEVRIDIDTLDVAQPWHVRLFVHDGMLWLYHPDLEVLRRWDLQPS